MSEAWDNLIQQLNDLQDSVQQMQEDQQASNDGFESRLEALENPDQSSADQFPLDFALQAAIEQTQFQQLTAMLLKAGLPIYTSARNTTQTPPGQGEIWLEDVGGTRKICAFISGTAYKVIIA